MSGEERELAGRYRELVLDSVGLRLRHALDAADRASPLFVEGVSCAHCHDSTTEAQKSAYAERQRQMERAAARAQRHVGQVLSPPPAVAP